jgi:CYTH domain-containing protein
MFDIFNKRKVEKLERELRLVREEFERDRGAKIELQKEMERFRESTINQLIEENQKLVDWIEKILEVAQICKTNEGLQMVNIPIQEEKINPYNPKWELTSEQRKEIIIPSIRYVKMSNYFERS